MRELPQPTPRLNPPSPHPSPAGARHQGPGSQGACPGRRGGRAGQGWGRGLDLPSPYTWQEQGRAGSASCGRLGGLSSWLFRDRPCGARVQAHHGSPSASAHTEQAVCIPPGCPVRAVPVPLSPFQPWCILLESRHHLSVTVPSLSPAVPAPSCTQAQPRSWRCQALPGREVRWPRDPLGTTQAHAPRGQHRDIRSRSTYTPPPSA